MQSTEPEIWKSVVGYEGRYEVSDLGRVRSLDRVVNGAPGKGTYLKPGVVLRPGAHRQGYRLVSLHDGASRRTYKVHRLVALAFLGPAPDGMEVCHNNSDPADNRAANLRWDTRSGNMQDAMALGRNPMQKRATCPRNHELVDPNLRRWEKRQGKRICYSCARENDRSRKAGRPFDDAAADDIYRRVMGAP